MATETYTMITEIQKANEQIIRYAATGKGADELTEIKNQIKIGNVETGEIITHQVYAEPVSPEVASRVSEIGNIW